MFWVWGFQILVLLLVLTSTAFFLGEYLAKVYSGQSTLLSPVVRPLENLVYRLLKTDPQEGMNGYEFLGCVLLVLLGGGVILFLLQIFQGLLPLNPERLPGVAWDRALNTAISFVTNTDWQPDAPEAALSYFTRIVGTGVQNFVATAVGISVALALIQSLIKRETENLGNFWCYFTRSILYLLLPLAMVLAVFLMWQGVPNNFNVYTQVQTLEGKRQVIAQGPVASQVAIKQLGASGGGFFAANAAHPYENPNALTDFVNIVAMLLISTAFPFMFGALSQRRGDGFTLFVVMLLLFIFILGVSIWCETDFSQKILHKLGASPGGMLAGREVRFGNLSPIVFSTAGIATSSGAANAAYTGFSPLTIAMWFFTMSLGVVFGSVGFGFVNLLLYVVLTMFLIALMIGKSPELYGKKLGVREMKLTVWVLFAPTILQLLLAAIALYYGAYGQAGTVQDNAALSRVLYAYLSTVRNNGSSLGTGMMSSTFYNLTTALAMLLGYLFTLVPTLMLSNALGQKRGVTKGARFSMGSWLFVLLILNVIVVVGPLPLLPSIVLGPIVDYFKLMYWLV